MVYAVYAFFYALPACRPAMLLVRVSKVRPASQIRPQGLQELHERAKLTDTSKEERSIFRKLRNRLSWQSGVSIPRLRPTGHHLLPFGETVGVEPPGRPLEMLDCEGFPVHAL